MVRAGLAASPRLAGSLAVLYEGFRDRWTARTADAVDEIASSLPAPELQRRLEEDPHLDAAVIAAVEAAGRTGLLEKRRLLGRVISWAVLDDSRVDEAVLLVSILSQIDAPHVRCLESVARAEDDAAAAGEVEPRAAYTERATVHRIAEVGRQHPAPVLAVLTSLGLVEASGTWGGGSEILKGITPFGRKLLDDLHEAAAGDS